MMKTPDLNHLVVFTKIIESGNLTRAASNLGLPKSRVSRILSQLEKDLNVQLIHRTTRHLQLTEIGRQFYERCRGPLAGLESASLSLHKNTTEIQGRIRLTAAQDIGTLLLPGPIDDFSRIYPKVSFEVLLSQETMNLVQSSIDVAIRIGHLKDSRLKVHRIADVSMILVATPRFLESHPPITSLQNLEHVPCLMFESFKSSSWSFSHGKEKKTVKVKAALTSNNPDFNLRMCLRGKGLALLPDFICREHVQSGSLVHLFKTWKSDVVPMSLVFPYQKKMPPHVRAFADYILPKLRMMLIN